MKKCINLDCNAVAKRLQPAVRRAQQSGLTMVELLVALVISMLISLAAISALVVTRQGFSTVDAASQLRDNGRFISDLIQRLGVQSGFSDVQYAAMFSTQADVTANYAPNIFGFNNARASASDPLNASTARTAGEVGDGSDILILRYQNAETFPSSGVSDQSMIDCSGNFSDTVPSGATGRAERFANILHVAVSQGEPTLMCTTVTPDGTVSSAQPIISGVENFQVLYGTDSVVINTAPTGTPDTVPDRYYRADQLTVTGNAAATNGNWRRVRSIRIGMVLRGPLGSQQERVNQTFYPFGLAKASSTGTAGSAMSAAADVNSVFTPAIDGRFRQVVTFTVHLRNDQCVRRASDMPQNGASAPTTQCI